MLSSLGFRVAVCDCGNSAESALHARISASAVAANWGDKFRTAMGFLGLESRVRV